MPAKDNWVELVLDTASRFLYQEFLRERLKPQDIVLKWPEYRTAITQLNRHHLNQAGTKTIFSQLKFDLLCVD